MAAAEQHIAKAVEKNKKDLKRCRLGRGGGVGGSREQHSFFFFLFCVCLNCLGPTAKAFCLHRIETKDWFIRTTH